MAAVAEEKPAITHLLEANRTLRQQVDEMQQLLAICAHDLRAPLSVMMAQAEVLIARGEPGSAANSIAAQGRRMRQLVEGLLDLQAASAGRPDLVRHVVELGTLLEEEVEALTPLAQERGIRIERRFTPRGLTLELDGRKIRQVVGNLVVNAVHQCSRGDRIVVAAEQIEGGVLVSVIDSGPGIPGTDRATLFEPGRKRRGLGLIICREFVLRHGGRIWAEAAPGGGTVVSFLLPGARAVAPPLPEVRGVLRVLVVDDDLDMLQAMAGALEPFAVEVAATVAEALECVRRSPPDAVVSDLVLGGLDGLALIERLAADPKTAEIPVLIASGVDEADTKAHVLEAGAVDYMVKPVTATELRARLRAAVARAAQVRRDRELLDLDDLTGLVRRRVFRRELETQLSLSRASGRPLSLVMVDHDGLKQINDAHGHDAGDRALVELARVLGQDRRPGDCVARLGGDEFALLLPGTTEAAARERVATIRARLEETAIQPSHGFFIPIRASFGVAGAEGEALPRANHAELLRSADAELYADKRGRRGS